jgi:hypothetical protein
MRKIVGFVAVAAIALMASAWSLPAFAQSAPVKVLSAAGTNSNLVLTGNVLLKTGVIGNSTATQYFLKLYNKATPPTCGTDVPRWTVPIPPNQDVPLQLGNGGLMFPLGLGICLTGAIADNDTTTAAAGVAINLGVSAR